MQPHVIQWLMLSSDLSRLQVEAHEFLRDADGPCSTQAIARRLFGPRRHEDPVAQLVARKIIDGRPDFLQTHDGSWCAADAPFLKLPLAEATFVVADLEATGSLIGVDKIIEVGLALVRGGEVVDRLDSLVRSRRQVSHHVRRLTGIDPRSLRTAPSFGDLAPRIAELLGEADAFVAHDVWFDLAFLRWELGRHGHAMSVMPALCTLKLARLLWPDLDSWRLQDLSRRFAVAHENPHRAGEDALATAGVLHHALERVAAWGVEDLAGVYALPARIAAGELPRDEDGRLSAHAAG